MECYLTGKGYLPKIVRKGKEMFENIGIKMPKNMWINVHIIIDNWENIFVTVREGTPGERREGFLNKLYYNKTNATIIKKRSRNGKSWLKIKIKEKEYEVEFRRLPIKGRKLTVYPFNRRIYILYNDRIYKSHNEVDIPFRDPSKEEAEIISAQLMLDIKEVKGLKGDIRAAIDGMINRAKEINKITGRPLNKVIIGKKYKEFIISRRFTGPPTNSYEICISYSPFDKEEFEEVEVGPFVVPIGRYLKKKELYDIVDKGNQPYYAITRKTIGDYTVLTSGDKIIGICKKLPRGRVDVYEYKGKVVAGVFYYVEEVITDHNKFPKKIKDYLIEKLWR